MRNTILAIGLCAATAGAAGYAVGAQGADKKTERTLEVNQVARVGQSVITAEQFIERLMKYEKTLPPQRRNSNTALDTIVAERLLELEADRLEARPKLREITLEREAIIADVDARFKRTNKELADHQKSRGLPEKGYTWTEFLRLAFDMTEPEFLKMAEDLARNRLLQRMVIGYWEMATVRSDCYGIYMQNKSTLEEVRKQLVAGADITSLAPKHSEDKHSSDKKGFIGTVYPNDGSLERAVDEAFWKLEENQFSELIPVGDGWWLLQRRATYVPNKAAFFDVREELLAKPNVDQRRIDRWRFAMASSERYAWERRMPGLDCIADQK